MKKSMNVTSLLLVTALCLNFSSAFSAEEEVALPVIKRPAVLNEGIQRELTPQQIADLLPWAKDSKVYMDDLLSGVESLASADKLERLVEGITSLVVESDSKNSELFMRYVLNRGLEIVKILDKEMEPSAVGTIDAKIRVLTASIAIANKYYSLQLEAKKSVVIPYAKFGDDYFSFLTELNKSVFDASAQYAIYKTSFEWLQWDLYRDLNNKSYASQVYKINNSLKNYPTKKLTDFQSISYIRHMKSVTAQLKIHETVKRVDDEAQIAQAKTEAERQLLIAKNENERKEIEQRMAEEELRKKYGNLIPVIQDVPFPSVNGIYFSTNSDVDAVCKAMGYQKGVPNSIVGEDKVTEGSAVVLNAAGVFTEAVAVSSRAGNGIKNITCANKYEKRPTYNIKRIDTSSYENSMIISSRSNITGVCRQYGFERGVPGVYRLTDSKPGIGIIFNEAGLAVDAEQVSSRGGNQVLEVFCVDSLKKAPPAKVALVDLKIFNFMVSTRSNADGVCKRAGYKSGLVNSYTFTDRVPGSAVIFDVLGEPIGKEEVSSRAGNQALSVMCIK